LPTDRIKLFSVGAPLGPRGERTNDAPQTVLSQLHGPFRFKFLDLPLLLLHSGSLKFTSVSLGRLKMRE